MVDGSLSRHPTACSTSDRILAPDARPAGAETDRAANVEMPMKVLLTRYR
jgi:hypothetical protein